MRLFVEGTPRPHGQAWKARIVAAVKEAKRTEKERTNQDIEMAKFCHVTTALDVTLDFYLPREKKHATRLHPIGSPDLDDLAKAVLDTCNGLLWVDDSQICMIEVGKYYATMGVGVSIICHVMI